ncbi:MAG: phosphoribosylformylglycinamidine synthase I [Patescibacteria group bacterium]
MKPNICVLITDGTNCDTETAFAFQKAGGKVKTIHINQLRSGQKSLRDFQIITLPGGFSYGDDIVSGKIQAIEMISFLSEQLREFIKKKGLIVGICNGFQILVRTGLLPFGVQRLGKMDATLTHNESGKFQCHPITMRVEKTSCIFTQGMEGKTIELPMAHGEGRFFAEPPAMERLHSNNLVVLRYTDNPNGSLEDIAGITDPSGHILGLMPHPERAVRPELNANWRRGNTFPDGLAFFQNAVAYATKNLS